MVFHWSGGGVAQSSGRTHMESPVLLRVLHSNTPGHFHILVYVYVHVLMSVLSLLLQNIKWTSICLVIE